jgi:hypothetical protein
MECMPKVYSSVSLPFAGTLPKVYNGVDEETFEQQRVRLAPARMSLSNP